VVPWCRRYTHTHYAPPDIRDPDLLTDRLRVGPVGVTAGLPGAPRGGLDLDRVAVEGRLVPGGRDADSDRDRVAVGGWLVPGGRDADSDRDRVILVLAGDAARDRLAVTPMRDAVGGRVADALATDAVRERVAVTVEAAAWDRVCDWLA
jgi:hypothetical protein